MWDCRHHHICYDESKILFAWAKHAEPTELPQDVGFALADDDHLVLQVVVVFVRSVPDPYGIGSMWLKKDRDLNTEFTRNLSPAV